MKTEWKFEQEGPHHISIDHDYWSGRASISVDEQVIFSRDRTFWDTGLEHRFQLDGLPCIIRVIARGFHFSYELWVDGKFT